MCTVEELLDDPEIKVYRDTHQGVDERIKVAARLLVEARAVDTKQALIKLLPALTDQVIKVFFSFKMKDKAAADIIVKLLRKISAGRLKITYQGDFSQENVGRDYRNHISTNIQEANWFILLFPDPQDEWDWCLFETGLFAAQRTSADRLFCFYPAGEEPPSPIANYHSVKAVRDEVEDFLKLTFLQDNALYGLEAINSQLSEDDVREYAQQIVDAIHKPKKMIRKFMEPWVELYVKNPTALENKEQLDGAIVRDANRKAVELFELLERKGTWGEFRENLPAQGVNDGQWREELFRVIRKIGKGHRFFPVQAVFQSSEGKMYRPVITAIDREDITGPIHSFHITFREDVSSLDRSAMPKNLSVLGNVLRSAFRFRWEVLEKFTQKPMEPADVERLENAITRIKQDWESRDIGDQQDILAIFNEESEQRRVAGMFKRWHEATNIENTGRLDAAIKHRETEKISRILEEFLPVSQEFLALASDKFAELVSK